MARRKDGVRIDYRLVHPGGAVRDIHTTGHPVVSPTGDLTRKMGTAIDITERKRAEDDYSGRSKTSKRFGTNFRKRTSCCVKSSVRLRCLKK